MAEKNVSLSPKVMILGKNKPAVGLGDVIASHFSQSEITGPNEQEEIGIADEQEEEKKIIIMRYPPGQRYST